MPDQKPEDPRRPTPDPVGLSEQEFEEFMRGIEKSLPQNLPSTSMPLSIQSALDAQKKKNTGVEDPRRALANEAAHRAISGSPTSPEPPTSPTNDMRAQMERMREMFKARTREREAEPQE